MGRKHSSIIIGTDPPTKEVVLMKTIHGYACLINDAEFPKGQSVPFESGIKRHGNVCCIQFTNADEMRKFGQFLVDFTTKGMFK